MAFAPASFASGVSVTDLTNGVTATQLAQSLASGGVAISNVTYTGADGAAGSFTGGTSSIGFDTGVVLSSANVQTHELDDPCSRGVEGPNNCYEAQGANSGGPDGGENSTSLGTAGDTDLDTLSGGTTKDAAVLSFDFVPQQSTVHFSYVFSSEEYSDFANTEFNDVFAFYVNGTNCALVPSGPGNAVWQFAAYNPSPGHSRAHGAASKVVVLGTVKKTITKAGTVTIIFKLKPGAKTKKLYKKVVKLKLKAIRVTLTFTTASGQTVTTITSVKLKR